MFFFLRVQFEMLSLEISQYWTLSIWQIACHWLIPTIGGIVVLRLKKFLLWIMMERRLNITTDNRCTLTRCYLKDVGSPLHLLNLNINHCKCSQALHNDSSATNGDQGPHRAMMFYIMMLFVVILICSGILFDVWTWKLPNHRFLRMATISLCK